MIINKIIVGELETNCYIVSNNNECIIIDPGDEKEKIINYIDSHKLKLLGVLITHHHEDHIGALKGIINYYHVPKYDYDNTINREEYNIGPFSFEVLYTLGHTLDSVSFFFKKEHIMFVGDFIFKGSIGRTDLGGDMNQMMNSIKDISQMNDDIILYPGHGLNTTLKEEKKHNIYFI